MHNKTSVSLLNILKKAPYLESFAILIRHHKDSYTLFFLGLMTNSFPHSPYPIIIIRSYET